LFCALDHEAASHAQGLESLICLVNQCWLLRMVSDFGFRRTDDASTRSPSSTFMFAISFSIAASLLESQVSLRDTQPHFTTQAMSSAGGVKESGD
jgi:hypothetical protein